MAFTINLGFATDHDRDAFVEKALPRIRGHQVDAADNTGEGGTLEWIGVSVTSPSAAKDIVHQIVASMAHVKNTRVTLVWQGADGQRHVGEIDAGATRDAELQGLRVSSAAKAHLDKEK